MLGIITQVLHHMRLTVSFSEVCRSIGHFVPQILKSMLWTFHIVLVWLSTKFEYKWTSMYMVDCIWSAIDISKLTFCI